MSGVEEVVAAIGTAASAAAPYAAAASAAAGAIGSIAAGQRQQQIAENNAATAKVNAAATLSANEADAARSQLAARHAVAAQENAYAGSGVDPGSGSAVDVLANTAASGALDSEIARWRGLTAANAQLTQGAQQQYQGRQDAAAGWIGGVSTLLTAGARYGMAQAGPRYGGYPPAGGSFPG